MPHIAIETPSTPNLPRENSFLTPAILVYGFVTTISQIVLMRELLVIFYGNELSMGLTLAVWLFWTALGSGIIVNRFPARWSESSNFLAIIFLIQIFLLPVTIFLNRISLSLIQHTPGEITGLLPIILIPLVTLSVFCILSGVMFTLACRLSPTLKSPNLHSAGKVYYLEASGACAGGLIASIFLLRFFSTFQILTFLGFLNFITAIGLFIQSKKYKILPKILLFLISTLSTIFLLIQINEYLEALSREKLWQGYDVVKSEESIYGTITVTDLEQTYSFFENGVLMFTIPDLLYAEESVHFALLQHPKPEDILLIGGGMNGSLSEILKHPSVKKTDYVELDPKLIELGREILPESQTRTLQDSSVCLFFEDGRHFIKSSSKTYDVIIVNVPDPSSAQINRFYSIEFYREIAQRLNPNGVFAFSVTSSENYISQPLAQFLGCIFHTLREVFPSIVVIPGNINHFLTSNSENMLSEDPEYLIDRLHERQIAAEFLNEFYLPFRMSPERMSHLQTTIEQARPVLVNYDFKPVAYYFDLILWSRMTHSWFSDLLEFLFSHQFLILLAILSILLIYTIFIFTRRNPSKMRSHTIFQSVMIVGFTEIGLEVGLILAFQAIYGYAYYQIAFIVSAYMIGLSVGSWISGKHTKISNPNSARKLVILQISLAILPLFILLTLNKLNHANQMDEWERIIEFVFPGLVILAGFAGGYHYPLSTDFLMKISPGNVSVGGKIYAFDLFGSCLGALVTSSILLPLLGINQTFLLFSGLNLLICFILILIFRSDLKT